MKEVSLKHKKIIADKLIPFGLHSARTACHYATDILDGQFTLELYVKREGGLRTRLMEKALGEEYTLHLVPDAAGQFVGSVRAAYHAVLDNFIKSCCQTDIFQSEQARRAIGYVGKLTGTNSNTCGKSFPENAVFRRKDTKTWYGAVLRCRAQTLGFDSDEAMEIIDLRMQPERNLPKGSIINAICPAII